MAVFKSSLAGTGLPFFCYFETKMLIFGAMDFEVTKICYVFKLGGRYGPKIL